MPAVWYCQASKKQADFVALFATVQLKVPMKDGFKQITPSANMHLFHADTIRSMLAVLQSELHYTTICRSRCQQSSKEFEHDDKRRKLKESCEVASIPQYTPLIGDGPALPHLKQAVANSCWAGHGSYYGCLDNARIQFPLWILRQRLRIETCLASAPLILQYTSCSGSLQLYQFLQEIKCTQRSKRISTT